MASNGLATISHGGKLGYYEYYARDGNTNVYKLIGQNIFLHINPRDNWTVRNIIKIIINFNV